MKLQELKVHPKVVQGGSEGGKKCKVDYRGTIVLA